MSKANVSLIVKEVLICIVLAVVAVALNFILFRTLFSKNVEVASAGSYTKITRGDYTVVNGDVQDVERTTENYATTPNELEIYQSEYRYEVGTINPFVSSDTVNDLPNELVGQSGDTSQ